MCRGIPEWPLPFWLKATALNSSEQPVTIVSVAISSYMHTAEEPEEEPEEVIFLRDLPLKTWTIWIRWWHLTAVALPLVFKKKAFGVIGAYLNSETHVVGIRIARLRAYWSATGRELKRLKEIKRSVA